MLKSCTALLARAPFDDRDRAHDRPASPGSAVRPRPDIHHRRRSRDGPRGGGSAGRGRGGGGGAAVVPASWLRRPRRWHAPALGALVLVALLTHVQGFLLGGGLLVIAGLRRD